MNAKTLALAAVLAALCAAPSVAADVDLTAQPVHCGFEPFDGASTPEWIEPRVTVSDTCAVSTRVNAGPQGGCPEIGPEDLVHPYVRLDESCDLTVRY